MHITLGSRVLYVGISAFFCFQISLGRHRDKCSGDPSDTLLLPGLITPPSPRLIDKPLLHMGSRSSLICIRVRVCVAPLSLRVMCAGCFSWCPPSSVQRTLKERQESKLPDVAQFSLTSTAASRDRKVIKPAIAIWLQLVFRPTLTWKLRFGLETRAFRPSNQGTTIPTNFVTYSASEIVWKPQRASNVCLYDR